MSRIPTIDRSHKICVICEGDEDYLYFNRLLQLNVWDKTYSFRAINAKGASNIPARFQDAYQNNRYELIIVFCDTDKCPYLQYTSGKKKINAFLNKKKAAEKLMIYANPCTMQIILLHFGDVQLTNQGKKTNSAIIEKLTGVKGYNAHETQINQICSRIYRRTYGDMRKRVAKIHGPDSVSASTNFIEFLERFESSDTKWISNIQSYLKS